MGDDVRLSDRPARGAIAAAPDAPATSSGGSRQEGVRPGLAHLAPSSGRWSERRSTARWRRGLVAGGALAAVVGLSFLLYQAGSHAGPVDSDSATAVLEGASLSHGSWALAGWALSRDSFWTIDAVFNMVGVLVDGVRPVLLYAVPAVVAALVTVVGAALAAGQSTRAGRITAVLTVVALLALPSRVLSTFYLQGPYHVATALYALVAFAGLKRRRFGWGWAGAVVVLGLGVVGDLQLAAFGLAPALGAGLLAMARRRSWREGVSTLAAVPASLLLAAATRKVADLAGTFVVNRANPTAGLVQMVRNLADVAHLAPSLLGVGRGPYVPPVPTEMPTALSLLHVAGIAVLAAGAAAAALLAASGAVVGSRRALGTDEGSWHLEDLLVLAVLGDIATFCLLDVNHQVAFARYLTAAIVFGAVLAGRLAGRLAVVAARRRLGAAVAGLAGAVLLAYGAGFGASIAAVGTASNPATTLASYLEAHHLTSGLGDYWSASIVTVESSDRVRVRPIVDAPYGLVARYNRENDVAWYAGHQFQFVVYDTGLALVEPSFVAATFGKWRSSVVIGPYRVLVLAHPVTISTVGAGA